MTPYTHYVYLQSISRELESRPEHPFNKHAIISSCVKYTILNYFYYRVVVTAHTLVIVNVG